MSRNRKICFPDSRIEPTASAEKGSGNPGAARLYRVSALSPYGNRALQYVFYCSRGIFGIPNSLHNNPRNALGLRRTTTRIRHASVTVFHRCSRTGSAQPPARSSTAWRAGAYRPAIRLRMPQSPRPFRKHSACSVSFRRPLLPIHLCLLSAYAAGEERCQSWERNNSSVPEENRMTQSSPRMVLLTHRGSSGNSR